MRTHIDNFRERKNSKFSNSLSAQHFSSARGQRIFLTPILSDVEKTVINLISRHTNAIILHDDSRFISGIKSNPYVLCISIICILH